MNGTYDKQRAPPTFAWSTRSRSGEATGQAAIEAEGLRAMVVFDFDAQDQIVGIEIDGAQEGASL